LSLFIIIILLLLLFGLIKSSVYLLQFPQKISFYLISLLGIIIFSGYFIFFAPYSFKNRTLRFLGSKNLQSTKEVIASKLFRSFKVIDQKSEYFDFYGRIWTSRYIYNDPESGWGQRIHKIIYPLTGENVEIVPPDAKGYMMDSTCNANIINGSDAVSYTQLKYTKTQNNEIIYASVYCFVSKDFNGDWARIVLDGSLNGNSFGYNNYDLRTKGTWQKLSSISYCKNGVIIPSLYFSKIGAIDFSSLKGYIIFASPNIQVFNANDTLISTLSKDPDIGWGVRVHKTVFPLLGKNVNMVPIGAKGYLMDSTCNADTWDGNAYSYSYPHSFFVSEGQVVKSTVYCYVSEDFNGNWARITLGGAIRSQDTSHNAYDLHRKDCWQKLEISAECGNGKITSYLFFEKTGVTDFKLLKGYVIFAYPKTEILNKTDSLFSFDDKSNLYFGKNAKYPLNFQNNSKFQSLKLSYDKNTISIIQNLKKKNSYYSCFVIDFSSLFAQISFQRDHDPIRVLASRLIHEDSSYYKYKSNLLVDTISDNFVDPRLIRWKFGVQIFLKEYNWKQKIFGNGFNFLNWYGYYFTKDKTKTDYPHNPFLYIILYSGIIGFVIYLILLAKTVYLYILYIKQSMIFFLFFLITFYFTFFSGGSPFDPATIGFFILLPFFINFIEEKTKTDPRTESSI